MPLDDRLLEEQLYALPEVVVARAGTREASGRQLISVVSIPDVEPNAVADRVLELLRLHAGEGAADLEVEVTPLGSPRGAVSRSGPRRLPQERRADAEQAASRVSLDVMMGVVREGSLAVEVTLRHAGVASTAGVTGSALAAAMPRVVAEATLAALASFDRTIGEGFVEVAEVFARGNHPLALVVVGYLVGSVEEHVVGCVAVRGGSTNEAVARAVLQATNRRFQRPHPVSAA